ncbi:SDR family NAD(P)-dependent oxidoreductase [Streptomyces celluloflavus]
MGAVGGDPARRVPADEAAWAYALDVNLTAHYRVCRALTPAMTERRWGRIVTIGSVNARAGRPGLLAYSTAKAGLQGFTRSLARELGPHGVCVNTVLPGAIQVNAEHHVPARHRTTPAEQIRRQCRPPARTPRRRRGRRRLPRDPRRILHHRSVPARRRWLAPQLTCPTTTKGTAP